MMDHVLTWDNYIQKIRIQNLKRLMGVFFMAYINENVLGVAK